MAGADVLTVPGFVGGEELPGDDRFVDLDPSTGERLGRTVARLGATEVDRAVAAARDGVSTAPWAPGRPPRPAPGCCCASRRAHPPGTADRLAGWSPGRRQAAAAGQART